PAGVPVEKAGSMEEAVARARPEPPRRHGAAVAGVRVVRHVQQLRRARGCVPRSRPTDRGERPMTVLDLARMPAGWFSRARSVRAAKGGTARMTTSAALIIGTTALLLGGGLIMILSSSW